MKLECLSCENEVENLQNFCRVCKIAIETQERQEEQERAMKERVKQQQLDSLIIEQIPKLISLLVTYWIQAIRWDNGK